MRPSVKFFFIPVLLAALQASQAFTQERKPLTLEECIDIALKNHPSIRAVESGVSVAGEQYLEAKSSYYPQVSANGSYTRAEVKSQQTFVSGESETYSATLNLNQKIYDFGRTGGTVDAAKSRVVQRGGELSRTRQDVLFNVKDAYFGVFKAMGLMKVQETSVAQAESHLRQAKGFYEAGAKAKFDVTNAEVVLNEANLSLIKARNAFKTSLALLKNRMGLEYNYPLEIDVATVKVQADVNLEEGMSDALKKRPEIRSIDAALSEAGASLTASKGGYYPNLTASASYGYYDQYPLGEGDDLFQEKNQRWNAGVSVNVPIFEGFLTNAKVSGAKANIDSLNAQKVELSNNITLEVTQAYLDLQDAEAMISVAESGLNKAKENLDIANGRYEAGVGTIIEVTDAQASYITAETDLVNARYDTAVARARFDRAVGVQ
ncbi:MAG: TolC family protein [Deltaproteobacteria bacterium]|nr:TolC family protein [Deltaproteobacteria bacterium]